MTARRRVLGLAPYPATAPSTRFRLVQLVDALASEGVDLTVRTFLDEDSWAAVRRGGLSAARSILGAAAGFRAVVDSAADYDAVLVQRGISLLFDPLFLRRLARRGTPLLYDFDDAVFLPQEGGRGWLENLRRPRATTTAFCRRARVVLAGNAHLAAFARDARAGRPEAESVHVLPTVVDPGRFRPSADRSPRREPVLGWVGSDSTLPYLERLAPALRRLQEDDGVPLLVVAGGRSPRLPGVDFTYERWAPEDEVRYFQEIDVGLYPLDDTPWSRGKCGFKAIQYLACEVPCVASPVGVLQEIVRPGDIGLHASTDEEWVAACRRLLADGAERRRMGKAGRERVRTAYSTEVAVATMAAALAQAVA